jgi:hypothetical protein
MKRNEILGEHKKGIKAVKYNKKPTNPADEHAKAKEKLKPIKPMEGYNINGVDAQHERELKAHHKAELKKKADAGDENAKKRLQALHDKEQARRDEFNARMERESIQQENRWGRRDFGYDDSGMSLAPGNDEGPDSWDYSAAHDRIGAGDPRRPRRHAPTADVPHDVYIDGRKWKTFDSASHANNVARKLLAKGKSVTVKASSTDEAMGAEVGKITKVDPATKKATLTKADGSSMEVDSTALKPTPDGKMSMDTPDTDELKAGTPVVSTEDMTAPTVDSSSPINGDEENVDLRRLQELAGQPAAPVEEGTESGKDLGNGFILTTTNFNGQSVPAVVDTDDNTYWIEKPAGTGTKYGMASYLQIVNGKADGKMPGDQTKAAMKAAGWKVSEPKPRTEPAPDTSANEPFVPKDYQTKEPLTKGPDGKWRNSKGEERDSLHGGPVGSNGGAMFRSMTPRTPTPESTDNQLLQKMLSIAGLR